jgi:hypothetical protein
MSVSAVYSTVRCIVFAGVILILSSFHVPEIRAQQPSVSFVQTFQAMEEQLPRERIFLHTDRQWYVEGDVIWFSAYVVLGPRRERGSMGTVLYVELIEPDGKVADRITVELQQGRAAGFLNAARAQSRHGSFAVRAYTSWALNFGEAYVFESNLHVFAKAAVDEAAAGSRTSLWRRVLGRETSESSPESDNPFTSPAETLAPDIQFLPEGGQMVGGLPARVAFKALTPDGLGFDFEQGQIFASDGETWSISTDHNGMGFTEFTPRFGLSYTARVGSHEYRLPDVQPAGITLRVDTSDDYADVTVRSLRVPHTQGFVVFAHVRGEVYYAGVVLMEDGFGEVRISMATVPTGVVHFTVLDSRGLPAAERLAFNRNNYDAIDVLLEPGNPVYGLRDDASLNVRVRGEDGRPLTASVSVSVFDDELYEFDSWGTDIVSRLSLETELKGHIESPGFYFSDDSNADRFLDLLMMTQGWRAYDMRAYLRPETLQPRHQPEYGFSMSGIALSRFFRRPVANARIAFSHGDELEKFNVVETDQEGRFLIEDLAVTGRERFGIRSTNSSGRGRIWVELDAPVPTVSPFVFNPWFNQPEAIQAENAFAEEVPLALAARSSATQQILYRQLDIRLFGELDEITITADREPIDQFERNLREGNRPSQQIDMNRDTYLRDLPFDQVLNQMGGVSMNEQGLVVSTGHTGNLGTPAPLVIVDGIVMDEMALRMMETSEVASVNVFRRSSEVGFWGSRGAGGVIVINTKPGDGGPPRDGLGFTSGLMEGYQPYQQFYAPSYAVAEYRDSDAHDGRITLYWNPWVNVLPSGNTMFFWTGDVPSTYRIVLQGITSTGIPFSVTRTFGVESKGETSVIQRAVQQ